MEANALIPLDIDIGLKLDKLFEGTGQGLRFESCRIGVDTSNNNTGFFALIDSSATDTKVLFNAADSPTAQGSIVLENIVVDSTVPAVRISFSISSSTSRFGQS